MARAAPQDLLREHLRLLSGHATAGAALYFLGRGAERANDFAAARTFYLRLANGLPNTYYAVLARARLLRAEVAAAGALRERGTVPRRHRLARAATLARRQPRPRRRARIERSRLLRTAGLADLADAELRFGARNGGQPALLAMEMAGAAEAPHLAMRIMKSMSPEYLSLPLDAAPRPYWDLLYPLPYRNELTANARERHLDASLLAGLIRQESEFNPQALSQAKAYGLTQVRPATGRLFARQSGVPRFSTSALFGPGAESETRQHHSALHARRKRRQRGADAGRLQRRPEPRGGVAGMAQRTASRPSSWNRFPSPKPATTCRPCCGMPTCTGGYIRGCDASACLSYKQRISRRAVRLAGHGGAQDQRYATGGQAIRSRHVDLLHAGQSRGGAGVPGNQVLAIADLRRDRGAVRNAGDEDLQNATGRGGVARAVRRVILVQNASREDGGPAGARVTVCGALAEPSTVTTMVAEVLAPSPAGTCRLIWLALV